MRNRPVRNYVCLVGAALLLLSLPLSTAKRFRSLTSRMLAPLWRMASYQVVASTHPNEAAEAETLRQPLSEQEKESVLALENQQLREEIRRLLHLLDLEQEITDTVGWEVSSTADRQRYQEAMQRRHRERKKLATFTLDSLPARVIYRSPSLWYGSLWIDVGEDDNRSLGRTVVAQNSPVVVGQSLIGVVDLVNAKQSRVRLITDAGLCPAVRAVRGDPQRQLLARRIDLVASQLAHEEGLFHSSDQRHATLEALLDIREQLMREEHTWCLAKGELRGSGRPLWRKQGAVLRGVGFNYDFADEEGPARDLVSGVSEHAGKEWPVQPIVQLGDILVTTGLDGVLPAGLRVAEVTHLAPLREGDYFYELEARPTAGDLDHLSLVSVLPPLPFNESKE